MKIHILGCGPSGGVPTVLGEWGECDPRNIKNFRSRSSLLLQTPDKTIVFDTSPDFRSQLLNAKVKSIDAVIYTHAHADHVMGMDELKYYYFKQGRVPLPTYALEETYQELAIKFDYLFAQGPHKNQEAILSHYSIDFFHPFQIGSKVFLPIKQDHKICLTAGYRCEGFAYSTDFIALPEESLSALYNLDVWVVSCLDKHPRPTHDHLDKVLGWIKDLSPTQVILTHLGKNMDYDFLQSILPSYIQPAYDGMCVEV